MSNHEEIRERVSNDQRITQMYAGAFPVRSIAKVAAAAAEFNGTIPVEQTGGHNGHARTVLGRPAVRAAIDETMIVVDLDKYDPEGAAQDAGTIAPLEAEQQ